MTVTEEVRRAALSLIEGRSTADEDMRIALARVELLEMEHDRWEHVSRRANYLLRQARDRLTGQLHDLIDEWVVVNASRLFNATLDPAYEDGTESERS